MGSKDKKVFDNSELVEGKAKEFKADFNKIKLP